MRIGILGGTFDPPHLGHIEFARAAMDKLNLDEVLFLPANRNPLKRIKGSPAKHRLEMMRGMIANEPKMAVSDVEISRGGASFMVETLIELQMVRSADYWLLLGADALKNFQAWRNPHKILKLARLGVALRPPMTETDVMARVTPEVKARLDLVPMKPIDISATELRHRFESGTGTVAPFVTPAVLQYIKQNGLYRS